MQFPLRALLAALVLAILCAAPASAADTASISGTVTDAAGHAVAASDVCVEAARSDSAPGYATSYTDASGKYSLTGLAAGSWRVRFYDCWGSTRNDVAQWYHNATAMADATPVVLTAAQAKTGVDETMTPATSISGHVYGGAGTTTPLNQVCVTAYSASAGTTSSSVAYANTDTTGAYKLTGLDPSGSGFKLQFTDCGTTRTYTTSYYGGGSDLSGASVLTPTAAHPVTTADVHMDKGASISGTVTDAAGNPITTKDVCVSASRGDGVYDYTYSGSAVTDATGKYTISGLKAASYKVYFSDCSYSPTGTTSTRNDVPEYYSDSLYSDSASLVVLSTGGAKSGIDAQLAKGTSISGHVYLGTGTSTPGSNVCVSVNSVSTSTSPTGGPSSTFYGYANTDASGAYTVSHLPDLADGYTVEFSDCNYSGTRTYLSEYYDNTQDYTTAVHLKPTVAAPKTGIDANLVKGGAISGSVTDESGHAITTRDICVYADSSDGTYGLNTYSSATTDASGNYTIGSLAPGAYQVQFSDCSYATNSTRSDATQYYDNTRNSSTAKDVTVTSGATTPGINAQMHPATSISGHVYLGAGTSTPLSDVCVYALPATATSQWDEVGYAYSSFDGSYRMTGLPAGDYKVRFQDCFYYNNNASARFAEEYYDGKSTLASATILSPTNAAPITGADAHLGPPQTKITGGPANNASSNETSSKFSFASTDSSATFECSLDSSGWAPCTSPYSTGTLANGLHTFSVRSKVGTQVDATPQVVQWTVNADAPNSTSSGAADAGESVSSSPGSTPSATKPVVANVTVPAAGHVTLTTEPADPAAPSANGYQVLGKQLDIEATTTGGEVMVADPSAPIQLTFDIDGSAIPAGTDLSKVTVLRNGTPAGDCTDPGVAAPDPCIAERTPLFGGGVELTVLTTHCSKWDVALATTPATTGGGTTGGGTTTPPDPGTTGTTPPADPAPAASGPAPVATPSASPAPAVTSTPSSAPTTTTAPSTTTKPATGTTKKPATHTTKKKHKKKKHKAKKKHKKKKAKKKAKKH